MALKMLLVRVDLAGIAFVLGVTEETVLDWLRRAALKAEAINTPPASRASCHTGAARRDVEFRRAQTRP